MSAEGVGCIRSLQVYTASARWVTLSRVFNACHATREHQHGSVDCLMQTYQARVWNYWAVVRFHSRARGLVSGVLK